MFKPHVLLGGRSTPSKPTSLQNQKPARLYRPEKLEPVRDPAIQKLKAGITSTLADIAIERMELDFHEKHLRTALNDLSKGGR